MSNLWPAGHNGGPPEGIWMGYEIISKIGKYNFIELKEPILWLYFFLLYVLAPRGNLNVYLDINDELYSLWLYIMYSS